MYETYAKHWTTLKKLIYLRAAVGGGTEEYTGDVVQFETAKAKKLKNLIVNLSTIQAGSGDPSPENIRPITGRTGASAWRTGKNLLKPPTWNDFVNAPETGSYKNIEIYGVLPNTTYYLSTTYKDGYTPPSTFVLVAKARSNNSWKSIVHATQGIQNGTITTGNDGKLFINIYNGSITEEQFNGIWENVYTQLEKGSTATDYEPYQGNLYSVDWTGEAGTVYSGTVDIVTGELRVRPEYPSYNGETLVGEWMSSMDKYVAGTTPTIGAQVVDLGGAETIYYLTPQEIMSLVGQNVVWSPDGEVTVRV